MGMREPSQLPRRDPDKRWKRTGVINRRTDCLSSSTSAWEPQRGFRDISLPKKDFKQVTSRTDQAKHRNDRGQRRKLIQEPTRPTHCKPCSHRKRHGFEQNPKSCECHCQLTHHRCRLKGQELNEHTCRCERPRR
ncbi:hypothetical protein chiPu_0020879 [Chiloscyllium punctatum]|uniref:Vascular endothelial growth factor heparin-binding domain-containing protein n=1 Tax=Chiloscyllium punctatum TaxID=137246 RepID=A0A401RKQ7_CHIPU|nr:hypothetical protein [Chiloscyllium punctatum]